MVEGSPEATETSERPDVRGQVTRPPVENSFQGRKKEPFSSPSPSLCEWCNFSLPTEKGRKGIKSEAFSPADGKNRPLKFRLF